MATGVPFNVPVKLTHKNTSYVFPVEVLINEKSKGEVTFTLARNSITHVHIQSCGQMLLNGQDSRAARFKIEVVSDLDDEAGVIQCRVACMKQEGWYLGIGTRQQGGKYGNVVKSAHCVGNVSMKDEEEGGSLEWLIELAPLIEPLSTVSEFAEGWDELKALTAVQKASFKELGYLLVPGGVPFDLCDSALSAIDALIEADGGRAWYESTEGKAQVFPELLALFWDTSSAAHTVAQGLLGRGNVLGVERAQLALRFPMQVAEIQVCIVFPALTPALCLQDIVSPDGLNPSGWHVDGTCKGVHSPFTLLLGLIPTQVRES